MRLRFGILLVGLLWTAGARAEAPDYTFETIRVPFTRPSVDDAPYGEASVADVTIAYWHYRFLRVAATPLAGNIWAEDVHLTTGGHLRRVGIGYRMEAFVQARMTLWIYENDAEDTEAPSRLVVGPIERNLQPARGDEFVVQVVNFSGPLLVSKNLWIAVSFDHDDPGLVVVDGEAQVGHTHNIYYDVTRQRTGQLESPYLANFVAEVRVDPVPTGVESRTWSSVKALYAPSDTHSPPSR